MRNLFLRSFKFTIVFFFVTLFFQCTNKDSVTSVEYNEAFNQYITAFSDHEISRKTPIVVRFTEDVAPDGSIGKSVDESLFSIDPAIEGTINWLDSKTMELKSDDLLPSNQLYQLKF